MFSRRRFIEGGVAGTLTGALAWESRAQGAQSGAHGAWNAAPQSQRGPARLPPQSVDSSLASAGQRVPLHAAIFDDRFAEAARFGEEAERLGIRTRAVRGDVTDLWYAELHPLWKRQPRPIAGLTAYAALFCLERLAWDHGMRLIYHGEHARLTSGKIEHALRGALEPSEAQPAVAASGTLDDRADWPAQIAALIARRERRSGWGGLPPARRAVETRFVTPDAPPRPSLAHARERRIGQPLHSWVIAPPARVEEPV